MLFIDVMLWMSGRKKALQALVQEHVHFMIKPVMDQMTCKTALWAQWMPTAIRWCICIKASVQDKPRHGCAVHWCVHDEVAVNSMVNRWKLLPGQCFDILIVVINSAPGRVEGIKLGSFLLPAAPKWPYNIVWKMKYGVNLQGMTVSRNQLWGSEMFDERGCDL